VVQSARRTAITVETPLIMKVMAVSLIPDLSPAHGKREIREWQTQLSR